MKKKKEYTHFYNKKQQIHESNNDKWTNAKATTTTNRIGKSKVQKL